MRRSTILALTILMAPLTACGGEATGPAGECTDDTRAVSVAVSTGSQPVFDWDPACSIAQLNIEEGGGLKWGIHTDASVWNDPVQANLIVPPVTYGVVPAGSEQFGPPDVPFGPPEPLSSGTTYEITLWRVLPPTSSARCDYQYANVCRLSIDDFVP
jgi:hypothetical protein